MFKHTREVPVGLPEKTSGRQLATWVPRVRERPGLGNGQPRGGHWSWGGAEVAQREWAG